MKNLYTATIATIFMILSASCTKDDSIQKNEVQNGPFEISITGEMGGFDISTKSSVESVVRMKWNTTSTEADKDKVWVFGLDGTEFKSLSTEGLTATSSEANPYTATLSGEITEIPSDYKLYLVHCPSGTYSKPEISTSSSTGSISFDMSAVEQSADVTPFIIYSAVTVSETQLSGLTANFSFATSVVKVNMTGLGASASLTKATVSNLNKNCALSFNEGSVTVAEAAGTPAEDELGTFTKNLSGSASAGGNATFLLAVPAISANADRKLTVTAGGKDYTYSGVFQGRHDANSYVNTICCVEEEITGIMFSISDSKKVKFTKGNLYYDGSSFHFEEKQYDYRTWQGNKSCINGTVSASGTPNSNVGLFYWASTAAKSYAETYSDTDTYFFVDGLSGRKLTVDEQDGCYALSVEDLSYLFIDRAYSNKYAKAKINGVNGLLIFPDGYKGTASGTGISAVNSATVDFPAESIPDATWDEMDNAGCVFLPVVGRRQYYSGATHITDYTTDGFYWTSVQRDTDYAKYLNFHEFYISAGAALKDNGMPIRLVYDVN